MTGKLDDLLRKPETAYTPLEDNRYKPEQDLAEKYRYFVGELLRLSLAGVAVFSFVNKFSDGDEAARWIAAAGVAFFTISIGLALWFLYHASEALRWYIAGLRHETAFKGDNENNKAANMLKERERNLVRCRFAKAGAASCLFLGALCMAAATAIPLVDPPEASSSPAAQQPTIP